MSENNEKAVSNFVEGKGVQVQTVAEMKDMCKIICDSKLVPVALNTPQKVFVAAKSGMECGLSFMAAVKAVYVIKGMPAFYGKAAKGIILNNKMCESWEEGMSGEGDDRHAWVKTKRKGLTGTQETKFSLKQARSMKLIGKSEPWRSDPENMMYWRCVGRHIDRWFSDVTMGMPIGEVVSDSDWPSRSRSDIEEPVPDKPDPLLMEPEPVAVTAEPEIEDADFEPVDEPKASKQTKIEKRVRADFKALQEKQGTADDMFGFDAFLDKQKPGINPEKLKKGDWEELGMVIEQKLSEFDE